MEWRKTVRKYVTLEKSSQAAPFSTSTLQVNKVFSHHYIYCENCKYCLLCTLVKRITEFCKNVFIDYVKENNFARTVFIDYIFIKEKQTKAEEYLLWFFSVSCFNHPMWRSSLHIGSERSNIHMHFQPRAHPKL